MKVIFLYYPGKKEEQQKQKLWKRIKKEILKLKSQGENSMRNIDFTDSINAVIQGDMDAFEYLYNQTYSYLRLKVSQYLKRKRILKTYCRTLI